MPAADFAPRTGFIGLKEFREAAADGRIRTVTPAIVDMWGRLQGKRLAADTFVDQLDNDAPGEACAYILASDRDMTPLNKYDLTGWRQGFQDIGVRPDLETIRLMPHTPGVALVHCDATDTNGDPLSIAPRQMLRRQLDLLESCGYSARIGWESEFMLYREGQPATFGNADYALNHHPLLSDFFQRVEGALSNAETPVEAIKSEGAPGQLEITFPYGPAMRACDNYTVYRQSIQHLAEEHGWHVNFMAAPNTKEGSGLHLHLSLWRNDEPMFADFGDGVPAPLAHAIGGLLSRMAHLAPLWAPFPNSYKRYRPYSFVPLFMNWGFDHRGCAIRVTGHGLGRHLELRLPGADANPYLAATATIAALLDGLINQIEPSPACTGDAYSDYASARIHRDLGEALHCFTRSDFAVQALGSEVVDHYATAAHHELDVHRERVTDVERERGDSRA